MGTVYKYCGQHGVKVLENLELKVTPPNEFNDPFEFTPRMVSSNPMRGAKNILRNKQHLASFYEAEIQAGTFRGSFRDYRRYAKLNRPEMSRKLSGYIPVASTHVGKTLLDRISDTRGVLCMSELRDSILMWGHYCNRHTGLVIGFDDSHTVFRPQVGYGMRPVRYVRERVLFDSTWRPSDPRLLSFEEKMIFSKNIDWQYEREVRQMFKLTSLKLRRVENGPPLYVLSIPSAAIVNLTLGARLPADHESKIRLALRQRCLSHVKIDRAELDGSEFALKFVPCGRS
jgi:Protein of unknown function (DUF2971)